MDGNRFTSADIDRSYADREDGPGDDDEDDLDLCAFIGCHGHPVHACEMCDDLLCEDHTRFDSEQVPLCPDCFADLLDSQEDSTVAD